MVSALLVFAAVVSVLAPLWRDGDRAEPGRGGGSWAPMARGDLAFLGAREPFRVLGRWTGDERFRVEAGEAAFENADLESVLRVFLRERLAGVQLEESFGLELVETFGVAFRRVRPGDPERPGPFWTFVLREAPREGETWFVAEPRAPAGPGEPAERAGPGADAGGRVAPPRVAAWPVEELLFARSTEDLKEKLARELARQLVLYLTSI